jgi:MOSC domain-containing protein YiiM
MTRIDAMSPHPTGVVVSVNVGQPREVRWHDRTVITAIWKQHVSGRIRAADVNLDGDNQADRRVHGGPTKAIYAYSAQDYQWWADALGSPLEPGTFGENLTVADADLTTAMVGERWQVGTSILRVTEPRMPCFKLGMRMGDANFVDRFADAARPGAYLAIEHPGDIGAGDTITLLQRPEHGVSIGTVERAYHGHPDLLPTLANLEELPDSWRKWARRQLARHQSAGQAN